MLKTTRRDLIERKRLLVVAELRHTQVGRYVVRRQRLSAACPLLILIAFLVLLPARVLLAQPKNETSCHAVSLETRLFWATSGAWVDEYTILVPDQRRNVVFGIGTKGAESVVLAEQIRGVDGAVRSLVQPSTINRVDDGYLIEDEKQPRGFGNDEIYRTDSYLNAESTTILIKGRDLGQGLTLSTVYDWSPIDSAGRSLLAFGDVQGPGPGDWRSAFLILEGNGGSEIVHTIPDIDDPVAELYMRTSSYITRANDSGYILFLDKSAKIGEVTPGLPGVRYLPSFPVEFSHVESLYRDPSLKGEAYKQATAQFRKLEGSKMPMGIVGWRGHLYLVAKEKMNSQLETVWRIIKLDPDTGDTLGEFVAPTTAAHIVVVPNEFGDSWALIEKGPVEGRGLRHAPYMNTSSMVVFPGAWLDDPENSPLNEVSGPPECLSLN